MELIQNWSLEDKAILLESIKSNIDVEYNDILIYGSRIHGDFYPTSDLDIVVYTKESNNIEFFTYYFDSVDNPESEYNNIRCSILFNDSKKYLTDTWESCGHDYFFPRYSIVNDKFYEGNRNHVAHHQGIRDLITEYKGWNVPFDDYNEKNKHLIIKQ